MSRRNGVNRNAGRTAPHRALGTKLTRLAWPKKFIGAGRARKLDLPSLWQRHTPIHAGGFARCHETVSATLVQGSAGGSASSAALVRGWQSSIRWVLRNARLI